MGGVAVGRGEELIEAVLREIVRRLDDGDFKLQPPESRASDEHEERRNRLDAVLQVGEPLEHEIAARKGFVVRQLVHYRMVSLRRGWNGSRGKQECGKAASRGGKACALLSSERQEPSARRWPTRSRDAMRWSGLRARAVTFRWTSRPRSRSFSSSRPSDLSTPWSPPRARRGSSRWRSCPTRTSRSVSPTS